MATLKEIKRRVVSVKSTQKITKAMKMVAAVKFRHAQEELLSTRPYARKMNELMKHLVAKIDLSVHPLLIQREVKKVLVIVVSGDRGMCGAFNGNVIKATVDHIKSNYADLLKDKDGVRILTIGKKAADYFSKQPFELFAKHSGIFGNLQFVCAKNIMNEIISPYLKGEYDKVEVVYNEFKSVVQQKLVVEQVLPILPENLQGSSSHANSHAEYIYEPSVKEIIDELLPKHLNFQLWRVLLESSASEEGARMTAMNNATENAKELIRTLTLLYNKERQASITKELLEIVSGAEALKNSA